MRRELRALSCPSRSGSTSRCRIAPNPDYLVTMAPLLKHRTLSAAILDQLRMAILDGTYPAGTQLRQDALAELYGVSRIPLREALFQLDVEGLVRIIPQKGAVVAELSIDEINDVFDLRALLEPRLLSHSMPLLDEADFARIEEIHREVAEATKVRDVSRWGQLNATFHMALYSRASLPRTLSIAHTLLQASDRYTRVQLSGTAGMEKAMHEHAELIALCRTGDIERACCFLATHVRDVQVDLIGVLERGAREASNGAAG